jgi:uncharacterized membrane protein
MKTALLILLICAALDLIACGMLLAVVWVEHRRVRREAATVGEMLPSAAGQFGCLIAFGLLGLAVIYGVGWFLLR